MLELLMACEDCDGTTFHVSLPDGTLYCSNCDEAKDGCYGQVCDLAVAGDGPLGWIGPRWKLGKGRGWRQ